MVSNRSSTIENPNLWAIEGQYTNIENSAKIF